MSDNLFEAWLDQTHKLQSECYGRDLDLMSPAEVGDYVQKQFGHAVRELCEMMEEYPGTKDWVTDRTAFNRDQFLVESVDALHFIGNILSVFFTDEELNTAYQKKMQKNRDRMASGEYDGVSDKCIICHRELEYVATGTGDHTSIKVCPTHGMGGVPK